MTDLEQMLEQKAQLERKIADLQRQSRADAISKVRSLMAEYGLTVADLGSASPSGKPPKTYANAGTKVAPKYRHPQTGETWSGRGLKPRWLQSALAEGRQIEDFLIG